MTHRLNNRFKIFKYYKYIYYKILMFSKEYPFTHVPEFWAMSFISLLVLLNFQSILVLIIIFTDGKIILFKNRPEQIISIVLALLINYLIFIYKKKYIEIVEEFKFEPREKKRKGNIEVLLFSIGSIVLIFLLNIIKIMVVKNH